MGSKMYKIQLFQVYLYTCIWIGISLAAYTTEDPSMVNTDATMMHTDVSSSISHDEQQQKTCQAFHCMGEHCYRNKSSFEGASNATCSTYCEMYRHNSSHYEARCNPQCMFHMCNDTIYDECSLHCCNISGCMMLDNITAVGNNKTMANTTAMSTVAATITSTTTTTTTIAYTDKKCRSFKCTGTDCYIKEAKATVKQCATGINFCELQKVVSGTAVSYEGGCSNTCSTSTKSCAALTNANCFQECCNATSAGCCMKLDGQVHFNNAAVVHRNSVLKIFICAFIVIFISRYFSTSRA